MALFELDGVKVRHPGLGTFFVAEDATVVGNVEIGADASIWFGCVVRGDNDLIRIGAGTNIQDGSVLHVDPGFPIELGEDVTVGHKVLLHGCKVGRGSLIGMGSLLMNGVVIGEDCLIGANTFLSEGKVIPPRSLVFGSPGKVVRELTDEDVARLGKTAGNYKRNWRRYATGLKPQRD